jgi:SNF2 family DNA or RNA helicase
VEVTLEKLNKTPVFVIQDESPSWKRAYGATYQKQNKRWLFPAFPPFIQKVQHDLPRIHAGITYSTEAEAWATEITDLEKVQEQVASTKFPVTSYEHQTRGLETLLHNWRYVLNWEMGTGKTKVIIDLMLLLKGQRALILCPFVGVENWVDEINKFSEGQLKVASILGKSRKAKFAKLLKTSDADLIVTSYDTARLYGIPFLSKAVSKVCKTVNQYPSDTLKKHLMRINSTEEQKRLTEEWIRGRKVRDIGEEVLKLRAKDIQWLSEIPYDVIVADESHRIKQIYSQRTKVCLRLAAYASRRYELTGTLSLGDPRDLYPQLKFLAPYTLSDTWDEFCAKHVDFAPWHKHIVLGYKNLHELNSNVDQVTDRKKLDDCVDLPARRFETVYFDLTASQMRDYNYAVKEMRLDIPDADPLELQNGAIRLSKLLQICSGFYYYNVDNTVCDDCPKLRECVDSGTLPGSPRCTQQVAMAGRQEQHYGVNSKLNAYEDLLKDLLSGGHKVITWANFTAELDTIEALLIKKKIKYVRVDGTSTKNIKVLSKKFQEDPNIIVYLGQITTGIVITLTAAKYVISYGRTFALEDWLQSLGRSYRIGQKEKTVVYSLCARGTVERQQLIALEQKENIAHTLTHKLNCLMCKKYKKCLEKGILPWTEHCVLSTTVKRVVSKAACIFPRQEKK